MFNPMMIYFPFGGRGELSRLAAAAGGVELDESPENDGTVPAMPSRNQKKLPLPLAAPFTALVCCPSPGVAGANFVCVVAVPGSFFGALPTLKHGDVELCQSQMRLSGGAQPPARRRRRRSRRRHRAQPRAH